MSGELRDTDVIMLLSVAVREPWVFEVLGEADKEPVADFDGLTDSEME